MNNLPMRSIDKASRAVISGSRPFKIVIGLHRTLKKITGSLGTFKAAPLQPDGCLLAPLLELLELLGLLLRYLLFGIRAAPDL